MPLTDTPTPTELADAHAHRAAVGRRADQIRRRRAGVAAGLVAALVLAVAVPLALTSSTGRSVGVVTTSPTTSSSSTTPPTSTATTLTTPTTVPPGTPFTFADVRLVVPHGWVTRPSERGTCIEPSPAPTTGTFIYCAGLWLMSPDWGPATPLGHVASGHLGWYPGTGMDCPFTDPGTTLSTGDGTVVGKGFRPVGNLTAQWEEWAARCVNGPMHHVQVWFLPDSNVLFLTADASPGIAQILGSVQHLSRAQDPLEVSAGTWGGRGTSLQIHPDGVGLLDWRTYRQCSATVPYPCDSPTTPLSTFEVSVALTKVLPGPGGSWSADGTITAGQPNVGSAVHLAASNGVVTITGGGFVAGTYPNGQLCSADLRTAATNGGCP